MTSAPARARILIIEDESDVRELMGLHLRREGHDVTAFEDGEQASPRLRDGPFDLLVLDWMLPGASGLEICKSLRGKPDSPGATAPILMVTARVDTADIVLGLEVGADDYITKPFEIPVFLARVRTLLRRAARPKAPAGSLLKVGELSLDPDAHRAFCGDEEIHLTPSEFKLLHALMGSRGRVLSRERLIDLVQGQGVVVIDRAIDTHVFGLRKKLGRCAEAIETIRGVGYRIQD